MEMIHRKDAMDALEKFSSEWGSFQRLPVNEATIVETENLVTNYDLRGYDAVHLAAAKLWQEATGEPVTLATFDHKLYEAALKVELKTWPEIL